MYCATGIGPASSMRRRISASSGMMSSVVMSAVRPGVARHRHQGDAGEHQRQRQQHPHRQPAPQEAELRIGLAKELADRAGDAIAERESAEDEARPLERAGADHGGEHDEQQQPFEHGLVELARVTRLRAAGRKHHCPRHVGRPAPQFAVDEIGDAAEENSDRPGRTGQVPEREDRKAAMACEQDDREHAAEKAAVERHAAFPELQALERMRGEIARVVEQHIADAPAEDDAERHPQHEVVEIADRHRRRPAPKLLGPDDGAGVEPAQEDADDIGKRIPADGDGPEADEHRVEGGERDDVKRHLRFAALRWGLMRAGRPGSQGGRIDGAYAWRRWTVTVSPISNDIRSSPSTSGPS